MSSPKQVTVKQNPAEVVQDFYERYPYPPPVLDLDKYQHTWQEPQRQRADYHLFWPHRPFREDYSILVAGCGTSQAAKHAMRWPNARVTGIDFSETSINCTNELKRKYDLGNLVVHQLPVERARELGATFDQVVCTGVLHHLPDPDAGLSALHDVLKPDGAMQVMVYAPYGRIGIYMIQDLCRRLGIGTTEAEFGPLVAALSLLPRGHPLETLLREAPDFRDQAALADALLHPQDRSYSVPELFAFLERGAMAFGRWTKQAQYSPLCGLLAGIPQSDRLAQLAQEDQFASAELFRGTIIRHSVVAYRNDSPNLDRTIDFSGEGWLDYVPIRQNDTIEVREKLPPGAAAVLINRTHTYRDIILSISPTEKAMYDAIDGAASVGAIAGSHLDQARTFFERLWWYDQVVFDASQTA
jgi:SAM-dependent methyltransferase